MWFCFPHFFPYQGS